MFWLNIYDKDLVNGEVIDLRTVDKCTVKIKQ